MMILKKSNLHIALIVLLIYANVVFSKTKRPKISKESVNKKKLLNDNDDDQENDSLDGKQSSSPTGTGIRFRATKIGIDYMTKIFGEVINDFVPIMRVPDVDQTFSGGSVHLFNMQIQNFKPADKYEAQTKSPNRVTWSMTNMNIGVKGDLDGKYSGKSASGQFDTLSTGTNMMVTTTLTKEKGASGYQMKATAVECKIAMKTFDFNVYNLPDNYQRLFQQYKPAVVNFLKPKLQDQLCRKIKTFINEDMNDKLKEVTGKHPLKSALRDDYEEKQKEINQQHRQQQQQQKSQQETSESQQQENQNDQDQAPKMSQQLQDILNNMYIDSSLTDNPKLTPDYADLFENGEISFQGKGGTPFGPEKMNDRSEDMLNRMIYLSISDFVMNSLLHQSYQHKLLNLKYNKETAPESADFLKSKCGTSICLTSVMPELVDQYPDNEFEFHFEPTEAPKMIVSSGNAKVNAKGNFVLFLRESQMKAKEIMRAALNAEADVKPQLNGSAIQGHLLITALNAKLLSTTIKNLNQARIDQLMKGARTLLQLKANRMLRDGVPLPASETYRLKDSKLYLFDRHMRIESDIELNKAALVNQIAKDFENAHSDSN